MAELNNYLRSVGDPIKTAMLIGQAKGGSTVAEQHLVNTFGMEQNLSKEERMNKFDTLLKDAAEKNPDAKAAHDKALESQKEMVNRVSKVDPFNIGQSIKDAKEYENKKFGTAVTAASNEKAELKAQLAKLEAAIKEKRQAVKKRKNPKGEFKKQQRQNARALDKIGKDLQKKEKAVDKTFEKQTKQIDKETESLVKQAAKQTKKEILGIRKKLKQDIAEEKKKIKKAEKEVDKASKKLNKVKNKKGVSQKKIDEKTQKLASKQTKLDHRKEVVSSLREQRKSYKENMPKDVEKVQNIVRKNQQAKKDMAGQARDNAKQELRQSAKEEIQKIHKRDYSVDAKSKPQQEPNTDKDVRKSPPPRPPAPPTPKQDIDAKSKPQQEPNTDKSVPKGPEPKSPPAQSLSNESTAPPVPPRRTVSAAQGVPPAPPPPPPPRDPAAKEVAENKNQERPRITQAMQDKMKMVQQKLGAGQMKFEGDVRSGSSVSPGVGGAGKEKGQGASR